METETLLINSMYYEHWEDMMHEYGVHILIGALLSALTIYRREMSSNRVFHDEDGNYAFGGYCDGDGDGTGAEDDDDDDASSSEDSSSSFCNISDEMEVEAEVLLDGAGLYCSGQPILALASVWLDLLTTLSTPAVSYSDESTKSDNRNVDLIPSDLLDHVGNFSSEPIMAAIAMTMLHQKTKLGKEVHPKQITRGPTYDPLANQLPPDVHVHIASFLHPKDVTTLASVSRSYREVTDSNAIWKTLWERDYAWLVHKWTIGQKALKRSNPTPSFEVDKEFYFTFGQCYLNYILAGQNTRECCLVGIHSHIYDITKFLDDHPGSPDTLMVHAGRDCTGFFEDMNHTMIARRRAKKFCVVADMSHLGGEEGCGVRPTPHTPIVIPQESDKKKCPHLLPRHYVEAGDNILRGRRQRPRSGTLQSVRDRLHKEAEQVQRRVHKGYISCDDALATVTPFYDPFVKEWRVWYTSNSLETVILPA